jgi:hypothetical protein
MPPLYVIGIIAVVVVAMIFAHLSAKRRREAMRALAAKLGLRFSPGHNRDLARRYRFIDRIRVGSDRYAYNILSGNFQGHDVILFDYHYETGSGDDTQDYCVSFFILRLPISVPELTIGPEGFLSKIAQAVGYDDIDFESHEFSRKFCVRSHDRKFAYDVCNARMIAYLLANADLTMEMERDSLAISFTRQLNPEQIEPNLQRLVAVRSLMPDYLFARS